MTIENCPSERAMTRHPCVSVSASVSRLEIGPFVLRRWGAEIDMGWRMLDALSSVSQEDVNQAF